MKRWFQPSQRSAARLSDDTASGRARAAPQLAARSAWRLVCLAWLTTAAIAAPDGDPLHSRECLRARAELDAALAAPDARHGTRLARARHTARQACLGTEPATRQRSGAPDPPQSVPPPAMPRPPAAAVPPAVTLPAPPVPSLRPAAITTCDPAGCWDSEGRRLNRMGPELVGPGGVCTVQGNAVTCP